MRQKYFELFLSTTRKGLAEGERDAKKCTDKKNEMKWLSAVRGVQSTCIINIRRTAEWSVR